MPVIKQYPNRVLGYNRIFISLWIINVYLYTQTKYTHIKWERPYILRCKSTVRLTHIRTGKVSIVVNTYKLINLYRFLIRRIKS